MLTYQQHFASDKDAPETHVVCMIWDERAYQTCAARLALGAGACNMVSHITSKHAHLLTLKDRATKKLDLFSLKPEGAAPDAKVRAM